MQNRENLKAYAAFASVSFFWGTTYLAIRIGVEVLPPFFFAGSRFLISGLILATFMKMRGTPLPDKADCRTLAIVGLLLLGAANGAVVWAEQFVASGLAALIVATLPFWMVGIEAALPNGERLTAKKILGIITGFLGLLILLWPELQGSMEDSFLKGILALSIAPLAWGSGSVYAKRHKVKTPPLMSAGVQMLIAGSVLCIVALMSGELGRVVFTTQGVASMVYLVIFGSIIGYGSFIYALEKLPSSLVSTYAYLNPVVAVFLGWLVLDERLDMYMVFAIAVILSGVFLVKQSVVRPQVSANSRATTEVMQPVKEKTAPGK